MSRSISIFGLGYVGSVTAACLAHKGYSVIGVDLSPAKVELLKSGRSPIVEPRMSELVTACHQDCRLQATTDSAAAVMNSEISFLCVGTPIHRAARHSSCSGNHSASGAAGLTGSQNNEHV